MEAIKVMVEVLDPTATVTETNVMKYAPAYEGGRMILTIGEHQYMVTDNGGTVNRLFTAVEGK